MLDCNKCVKIGKGTRLGKSVDRVGKGSGLGNHTWQPVCESRQETGLVTGKSGELGRYANAAMYQRSCDYSPAVLALLVFPLSCARSPPVLFALCVQWPC